MREVGSCNDQGGQGSAKMSLKEGVCYIYVWFVSVTSGDGGSLGVIAPCLRKLSTLGSCNSYSNLDGRCKRCVMALV